MIEVNLDVMQILDIDIVSLTFEVQFRYTKMNHDVLGGGGMIQRKIIYENNYEKDVFSTEISSFQLSFTGQDKLSMYVSLSS